MHILHTLGGCGGTLLSRCIGSLTNVALLSEVNPSSVKLFPEFDPIYQDRNWNHLLSPADLERFSTMDFSESGAFRELCATLYARSVESGRYLVLRDYNYVDFVGVPFCELPPRELTVYSALPAGIPTRCIALIRHPMDQWASLRKHQIVSEVLTPGVFCQAYATFLSALNDIPIYMYEDFVEEPQRCFQSMCDDLGLPFDPGFVERFHSFDSVTGDFSRHQEKSIVAPPRRSFSSDVLEEFAASAAFASILSATGYRWVEENNSDRLSGRTRLEVTVHYQVGINFAKLA